MDSGGWTWLILAVSNWSEFSTTHGEPCVGRSGHGVRISIDTSVDDGVAPNNLGRTFSVVQAVDFEVDFTSIELSSTIDALPICCETVKLLSQEEGTSSTIRLHLLRIGA